MTTLALTRPRSGTVVLNGLLCAAVLAIPILSHALALPLYRFEPMRLLLFAAVLASSRRNALGVALLLPLVSWLGSGHPVFPKVLLIMGELALNVALFFALRSRMRFAPAAIVSVAASKAAYYGAKFLLLRWALMDGDLVATPWTYQLVVLALILVGGGLVLHLRDAGRSRPQPTGGAS